MNLMKSQKNIFEFATSDLIVSTAANIWVYILFWLV